MDTLTSGQAAAALGTSVPRVLRAAGKGLRGTTRHGNRTMFSHAAVAELRQRWGWTPKVPGFSAEELRVAAALSRRPFGLRSQRGIAREAGLSPSATGTSLRKLIDKGLVGLANDQIVEGHVRDTDVWRIRWLSPDWTGVAPRVAEVELPERRSTPRLQARSRQAGACVLERGSAPARRRS